MSRVLLPVPAPAWGPANVHPVPSCIDGDRVFCLAEEQDQVQGRDLFGKIEERFSFRKRILLFAIKHVPVFYVLTGR